MNDYKVISENSESTVVGSYEPDLHEKASSYQSEAELEKALIDQLKNQAYGYIDVHSEQELIQNLRIQLEELNHIQFTDHEWDSFFDTVLANPSQGIAEKTKMIQEDFIQHLQRDDGTTKNIFLIDKKNIHNNSLQVLHQYDNPDGRYDNRYDVTILVNGLPLVHIELKKRGVDIREAFNQIKRYNRDSFWAGRGLFQYIQIFVISNGTQTKYYSNTTRSSQIKEMDKQRGQGKYTSSSFEFTSWWADGKNRPITDLLDFAKTFLSQHTILNILTKYCVFTVDEILLVMRPYQITAAEKILNRIQIAHNYKLYGTVKAGGYIWHTTGSGKTLTSFKTARLATGFPFIEKVLFVVDRKDLDYQTMKEYDKFEKGAANSSTSTAVLAEQLSNPKDRIIITTIQKLSRFIKKNPQHPIYQKEIVIIFDECHRSQFGDMHTAITKCFKKYELFGFTGTPIFAANANKSGRKIYTTEQAFGEQLHSYTVVNAIADKNVLPFRVDYISTMRAKEEEDDEKVYSIDREKALLDPRRIRQVTEYILDHFAQKTKRNRMYQLKEQRLAGFNAIFAAASIEAAKKYYAEFQRQMEQLPSDKKLKMALIYSYGVNEEDPADGLLDDEDPGTAEQLDMSSRDFLEKAIQNYNRMFHVDFDTSADKFSNYYKDISQRMKNRQIDLLIVVNMFLTGFDAPTLNTLWADKNLRLHGLMQAFSRTNRILNSIKTFGNIVCFRNLEKETNESLALFGDKNAAGVVLMKTFEEYYSKGYYDGAHKMRSYEDMTSELQREYPLGKPIISESAQKDFIRLYGAILKLRNILTSFDQFDGKEILTDRNIQDYQSIYIDLYNTFRNQRTQDKEEINDDIVFEMELIRQVEINIDYILALIEKYYESHMKNKELVVDIRHAIDSSMQLRNKKDLILDFIEKMNPQTEVYDDWKEYVAEKKEKELNQIIAKEKLKPELTKKFMARAFQDHYVQTEGTELSDILPPMSRFTKNNARAQKKMSVIEKLKAFFEKFQNI